MNVTMQTSTTICCEVGYATNQRRDTGICKFFFVKILPISYKTIARDLILFIAM